MKIGRFTGIIRFVSGHLPRSLLLIGVLGGSSPLYSAALTQIQSDQRPLSFEENRGQTSGAVRFIARQNQSTVYLTEQQIVFRPTASSGPDSRPIQIIFENANRPQKVAGAERLPGIVNYLKGSAKKDWLTQIPTFARVRYKAVYPGIDIEFHSNNDQLEYDFIVAPRADPGAIVFGFAGMGSLAIDDSGALSITRGDFQIKQMRPSVYQQLKEKRVTVDAAYKLEGDKVSIALAAYDNNYPLVIDPLLLIYSTYLGGKANDEATAITVDNAGNAYITGQTASLDFTTALPLQAALAGDENEVDVFVSKFSADGSVLIYSSYLGGSDSDEAADIAIDAAGNVSITGFTTSEDFPLSNAIQASLEGVQDAFVTKLDPTGTAIVFSTFLGGGSAEFGHGIAIDDDDDIYVMGFTTSDDFHVLNALQDTYAGEHDAFVTKLHSDGSAIVYSTYLGGSNRECFSGIGDNIVCRIAVDSTGSAIIGGSTTSDDFPTDNAFQPTNNSSGASRFDGFISKLSADGSSFEFSTYLGGNGQDIIKDVAVDLADNVYVTGHTPSDDFPTTAGALLTTLDLEDAFDSFVSKFNPGGVLLYSTYLGGTGIDQARGIDVTPENNAVVTGTTTSVDFSTLMSIKDPDPSLDIFITALNDAGDGIIFSTYFGGEDAERSKDVATRINTNENLEVYLTGFTTDESYPLANALQPAHAGERDAIVSKFEFERPQYPYEYTAKVICGRQAEEDNMRLARGFYATTINIHSPNHQDILFFKKLALSYPPAEQRPGDIMPIAIHELAYDEAIAVDCENLSEELFDSTLGDDNSRPYIEGFIVVQSTASLDVTSVYTTAALDRQGAVAEHSSIHIEQVSERFTGVDVAVTKTLEARVCQKYSAHMCWLLFEINVTNNGPNHAHNLVLADSLSGPLLTEEGADLVGLAPGPLFSIVPGIYLFNPGAIGSITAVDLGAVPQTFELGIPLLENGENATFRFWALAVGLSAGQPLLGNDPPTVLQPNLLIDTVIVSVDEVDTNNSNDSFTLEVEL